jgi:hypothetical protein
MPQPQPSLRTRIDRVLAQPDSRPSATALRVCYRDAANYKNTTRVVLTGRFDEASFRAHIQPKLEDGAYFTPRQVGLPDAHFDNFDRDDHPAHTFSFCFSEEPLQEVFEIVPEQPTLPMTWAQLCARFTAVTAFDPADWPGHGSDADLPL